MLVGLLVQVKNHSFLNCLISDKCPPVHPVLGWLWLCHDIACKFSRAHARSWLVVELFDFNASVYGLDGRENFTFYWTSQTDAPHTIDVFVDVFLMRLGSAIARPLSHSYGAIFILSNSKSTLIAEVDFDACVDSSLHTGGYSKTGLPGLDWHMLLVRHRTAKMFKPSCIKSLKQELK